MNSLSIKIIYSEILGNLALYLFEMKQITLLILILALFQAVFAKPQVTKNASLENAGYSVWAIDAENGQVICKTPQVSLVPASVMKIITTAAALEILGPEYQFHTQIGFTGKINSEKGVLEGNLMFRGGCDPSFYSEYFAEHYQGTFEAWARSVAQKGIQSVDGDILVDLSEMPGQSVPGGWLWEDIGNYYGAGVSALNYCDNQYKILFSSAKEPGKPVIIGRISPTIDSLHLINKVCSSETNRDQASVFGAPGSLFQMVEGTIPAGRTDFVVRASMPDPARCAAGEFIKVLKSYGINFSGRIRMLDKSIDSDFNILADKASPPLHDLIVPLNQESINLFAEQLLREIGRVRIGSPAIDKSLDALKEFWFEKKIFMEGFFPTDGSGLSRSNGVCPRTLAEVIHYMYKSQNRDLFFKSLPVAGQSGTLKSAFKGSGLENNLQAKTGSMTRVRSLAGIFTNKGGRKVIFAVIANNFDGTQAEAGKTIEQLINEIYALEISD